MTALAPPLTYAAQWRGRPTIAVVDLDVLAGNVRALRSIIGPKVRLMAVVKANGYGHGAIPTGKAALAAGADELAVATVDEGAQLRRAGVTAPVLVLGPIGVAERPEAIGHGLGVVVSDASFAHALAADAKMMLAKEPVSVHLKIDTGMHRFGVESGLVVATAQAIAQHPELRLDGVMTHMASADAPDPATTHEQNAVFDRCLAELHAAGIETTGHHSANSATTLRFPEYRRDRVRVGVAIHGLRPDTDFALPGPLTPTMTIHSRLSRIHELQAGEGVSYGLTYRASGPERVGLLPLGYGDGFRRALSSRTWVAIGGQRADQLGRICMDQLVVRVPDGVEGATGELVTVVGNGTAATDPAPTMDELAALVDSISYDMSTSLTPRLTRLYVRGGEIVAVADLSGYRELA